MIHFPLDNNNALTTPRLKIHSNAPTMSTFWSWSSLSVPH